MKWKFPITLTAVLLLTTPLHAYWSETHKQFAKDIYKGNNDLSIEEGVESVNEYYSNRLGFPLNRNYTFDNIDKLDWDGFVTWTYNDASMVGTDIFNQGADDEDLPTVRATNHFFDPANDQSLGQSINERGEYIYQFDDLSAGVSSWMMEAIKAPDWALEDITEAPNYTLTDAVTGDTATYSRQVHSLRDSYDYLYKALTSTDLETRKKQMGAHIYALGHVIHLLTDIKHSAIDHEAGKSYA